MGGHDVVDECEVVFLFGGEVRREVGIGRSSGSARLLGVGQKLRGLCCDG